MKAFLCREVEEAKLYAAEGGQALHLHAIIVDRRKAPACFKAAVARGERIAHLFDRDRDRLVATVKRLGVRVVAVEREGTTGQHVDLCGAPLRKAVACCDNAGEPGISHRAGEDDEEMRPLVEMTIRAAERLGPSVSDKIGRAMDRVTQEYLDGKHDGNWGKYASHKAPQGPVHFRRPDLRQADLFKADPDP